MEKNEMWHGTFEEYCRLYDVASRHMKAKFPHLKIGGFASCGVGGWKTASFRITDETRAFEEAAFPSVLPPWSFIVAELSP